MATVLASPPTKPIRVEANRVEANRVEAKSAFTGFSDREVRQQIDEDLQAAIRVSAILTATIVGGLVLSIIGVYLAVSFPI